MNAKINLNCNQVILIFISKELFCCECAVVLKRPLRSHISSLQEQIEMRVKHENDTCMALKQFRR